MQTHICSPFLCSGRVLEERSRNERGVLFKAQECLNTGRDVLSTCAALNMEGATQGDAGREWREKLRDEEDKQELNCGWDVRHLEDRVVEERSQMEDSFGEEAKFVEECHKGSPSRDYHNGRESCLEQDWPEC